MSAARHHGLGPGLSQGLRLGLGLAAGLLAGGFVWFCLSVYAPPPLAQPADAIVVLTGGNERVASALGLLRDGMAPRLFISGVSPSSDLRRIARAAGFRADQFTEAVELGYTARTTAENAREIALWAKQAKVSTVLLVTSSYHMPRARLDLACEAPGLTVLPYTVAPDAAASRPAPGLGFLLGEYAKLLVASSCLLTHGWPGFAASGAGGRG